MDVAALAVGLVAYNALANRWAPFHGWAYVPLNLAATAALALLALGPLSLSRAELGLDADGWWIGLGLGVAIAAVPLALAGTTHGTRLVADERMRDVRGGGLAYVALVRIPIGTALFEEVAFRGVLMGAGLDRGRASALAVSSIVFGLWHVVPTADLVAANRPAARPRARAAAVAGGVVATSLAGIGLGVLRLETSLAAPIALHAAMNSLSAVAAARAWARRDRAGG